MKKEIQYLIEQQTEVTGLLTSTQLAAKLKEFSQNSDGWFIHQLIPLPLNLPNTYGANTQYLIIKNRYYTND